MLAAECVDLTTEVGIYFQQFYPQFHLYSYFLKYFWDPGTLSWYVGFSSQLQDISKFDLACHLCPQTSHSLKKNADILWDILLEISIWSDNVFITKNLEIQSVHHQTIWLTYSYIEFSFTIWLLLRSSS